MSFIADKQTLEDLNILGKYKANSIFNLFNKTKTPGGEKLLEQMFQFPLSDYIEINQRAQVFRDFQNGGFTFPIPAGQMEEIEKYLHTDSSACGYTLTYLSTARKFILALLWKDEQFELLQRGIESVLSVLTTCINDAYLSTLPELKIIMDQEGAEKLLRKTIKPGNVSEIVQYDYLFRQKLRTLLKALIAVIYHADVCISVTDVARVKGFCYPTAVRAPGNLFYGEGMWHPRLEKAVSNDIKMDGSQNLIFLTGANMAGKSTIMKTFGIGCYLAHMGFPVAAKKLDFSIKSGIYSSINVSDDLNMGYSHFYAEVLRVKAAAQQVSSGKSFYVIFDELFKGTNVKDAYDATLAVTKAFFAYKTCFFIISTHIMEVGEALQSSEEHIQYKYMPTEMEGNKPRYTYAMQNGITADRQGMMIIENEGILNMLSQNI